MNPHVIREAQGLGWWAARALVALVVGLGAWGVGDQVQAASTTASTTTQTTVFGEAGLTAYPPHLQSTPKSPMVMLVASKDHTLFSPIYSDFEDVDGDGVLDFTFKPGFLYYGYFDPKKCYAFVTGRANGKLDRFEPKTLAGANSACNAADDATDRTSYWSGNFLNWVTMTRVDVVRKLLYGGFRREDDVADTTLEMAHMSTDAHSFVKYYSGSDVGKYTPYTDTTLGGQGLTICNRGSKKAEFNLTDNSIYPLMRVAKGNFSLWATIGDSVCRWDGELTQPNTFGAKSVAFIQHYATEPDGKKLTTAHAHKAAVPNVATDKLGEWAVRVQACPQSSDLRGSEQCSVYTSSSGSLSYKPTGLLQKYGTSTSDNVAARAEFGLLTGSFDKPLTGGVLRKNVAAFNNEINSATGQFCYRVAATSAACQGVVSSMDQYRLADAQDYNARIGSLRFVKPEQLSSSVMFRSWGNPISEMVAQAITYFGGVNAADAIAQGVTAESLKATYGVDKAYGLPLAVPIDPLRDTESSTSTTKSKRASVYGHGICRPMDVLAISSSSASFDSLDSKDDGNSPYNALKSLPSQGGGQCQGSNCNVTQTVGGVSQTVPSVAMWTDYLSDLEGITNTFRSIGSVSDAFGQDCTAKTVGAATGKPGDANYVGGLSAAAGICPDAPGLKGSYLGAGAAFYANTSAVRKSSDIAGLVGSTGFQTDKLPAYALRVKTYAASLSGGVARVEVPIPTAVGATDASGTTFAANTVTITPESTWLHDGVSGYVGAMLTFRAIGTEAPGLRAGQTTRDPLFGGSGSYVVTWNDTQFGGDYDMDIVGFLRWELTRESSTSTSWTLNVYSDLLNVDAGAPGSHGFSIIGADRATGDAPDPNRRYLTHSSNKLAVKGEHMCADYDGITFELRCNYSGDHSDNGVQPWPRANVAGGTVGFFDEVGVGEGMAKYTTTARLSFTVTPSATPSQASLHDPLWYMAKYGSFDTGETDPLSLPVGLATTATPDKTTGSSNKNWDREQNNPTKPCAGVGQCADGEPDGYFLARRPDLMEKRLTSLLDRLAARSNTVTATSSSVLLTDTMKYVALFNQTADEWYGDLQSFKLKSDGMFDTAATWSASSQLAAYSARSGVSGSTGGDQRAVITNDVDADGKPVGRAFLVSTSGTGESVSASYISALTQGGTASSAKALVDFVRGSKANEGSLFRARKDGQLMGPVVDGSPWVQNPNASARFTDAMFAQDTPSYAAFVRARYQRNKVVWVSSHDGMLHGFEASTGLPMLSYVPSPVVSRLADQSAVDAKSFAPLVDGGPFTADVLIGDEGNKAAAWRTYLFGSLGRGGRAVFALDVSDTGATTTTTTTAADASTSTSTSIGRGDLTQGNAANLFKWIFTSEDDADLGYSVAAPVYSLRTAQPNQVVRLNNGKFGVLIPNGIRSGNGLAKLFVLFAEGPGSAGWSQDSSVHYVKLSTNNDTDNGLTGVAALDLDGNGTMDVVYGTDLRGNVWKFDIRDADPANWGSAFKSGDQAVPFVKALGCGRNGDGSVSTKCDNAVAITTHPILTRPEFGGTLVSFGTGRSIDAGDFPQVDLANRFVTVWDRGRYAEDQILPPPKDAKDYTPPKLPSMDPTPATGTGKSSLDRFLRIRLAVSGGKVYRVQKDASGQDVPVPEGSDPPQFNSQTQDGWYLDFPSVGEQLIATPIQRNSFISFTTVRALTSGETDTSCAIAPTGRYYAIDASSGLTLHGLLGEVLGSDVVGQDAEDLNVNVAPVTNATNKKVCTDANGCNDTSSSASSSCPAGYSKAKFFGQNTDASGCSPKRDTRMQWRELPGLRTYKP